MDKRLFDAQIKATEVQGLLAHIAKERKLQARFGECGNT